MSFAIKEVRHVKTNNAYCSANGVSNADRDSEQRACPLTHLRLLDRIGRHCTFNSNKYKEFSHGESFRKAHRYGYPFVWRVAPATPSELLRACDRQYAYRCTLCHNAKFGSVMSLKLVGARV